MEKGISRRIAIAGSVGAVALGSAMGSAKKPKASNSPIYNQVTSSEFREKFTDSIAAYSKSDPKSVVWKDGGFVGNGKDVTESPTTGENYQPHHMAFFHLKFSDRAFRTVDYAHYETTLSDQNAKHALAAKILEHKARKGIVRFKTISQSITTNKLKLWKRQKYNPKTDSDFSGFSNLVGFGSQHDIYFLFDGDGSIGFDPSRQLFIGFPPYDHQGNPTSPNSCYFNQEVIGDFSYQNNGKNRTGIIFRWENWFLDTNGVLIKPDQVIKNKLFLFFLDRIQNNAPIYVDPDTGNGNGYEP